MHSLLALPVVSHGRVLGNLYLTEKETAPTFDADDEQTLGRFATLAALAIENARLHRQVRALAVTEERERIAREMHDSLAQVLGYVNTKAQAAQTLLENDQPERAAAQLNQLSEAAREAYADVREGILGLRTSLGEDRGFIETLQDYLDRWQAQSDVTVELILSPPGYDPGLAPMSEVQLLRIIQEALSNVRKHARARRAWVRLRPADTGVEVVIEDNGVGFDPDGLRRTDVPRFGMATMRERAEAVGGTFEITAGPGQGTRVTVHLPTEPTAAVREETAVARADR
jgi:signal transduction histidine kinase